jgi:hypothetical protein
MFFFFVIVLKKNLQHLKYNNNYSSACIMNIFLKAFSEFKLNSEKELQNFKNFAEKSIKINEIRKITFLFKCFTSENKHHRRRVFKFFVI